MELEKPNFNAGMFSLAAVAVFAMNVYGTNPPATTQPDNSKINQRDDSANELTAEDQGNSKQDIDITRRIRRQVTDRSSLSVNAQNIKIITIGGKVTLKGPVKSAAEKAELERIATRVAGPSKVKSLIEIEAQ